MRHPILLAVCIAGVTAVAGCGEKDANATVERAFKDVNVVDESNLSDVMLTVADPNEAGNYFRRATTEKPERLDLQRGLAQSLVRAKRNSEAAIVWERVAKAPEATLVDRVEYADALIRAGDWNQAESILDSIPPTHETFKRYRLEAMIADGNKEWKKAYEVFVRDLLPAKDHFLRSEEVGALSRLLFQTLKNKEGEEAVHALFACFR